MKAGYEEEISKRPTPPKKRKAKDLEEALRAEILALKAENKKFKKEKQK